MINPQESQLEKQPNQEKPMSLTETAAPLGKVAPDQQKELEKKAEALIKEAGGKPSRLTKPLLVVFFLLLAGGLVYFLFLQPRFLQTSNQPATPGPTIIPTPTPPVDLLLNNLQNQNDSDEIEAIEADLEATDLSRLDQELEQIETELAQPRV